MGSRAVSVFPRHRPSDRGAHCQTDFNIISGTVAGLLVKGWMGAISAIGIPILNTCVLITICISKLPVGPLEVAI